eukprot:CAMPEP_0198302678 /NCGR_PEP_ID=MMETSP1449-20131203/56116_1 /TAXON_ID=420275 /ORGANISM="Attheya septentrionalis, Strain CCMP2084" /LENGTH=106 /DNA_ID=CAMNT_0044005109 /DNA_START=106 /DNA_END=423 /DNA_ORIENTATION=-
MCYDAVSGIPPQLSENRVTSKHNKNPNTGTPILYVPFDSVPKLGLSAGKNDVDEEDSHKSKSNTYSDAFRWMPIQNSNKNDVDDDDDDNNGSLISNLLVCGDGDLS